MPDPNDFTIGCICALVNEAVALRTFLDEEYDFSEQDDDNNYTAGSIGAHKIVVATLPFRSYGIAEAAGVIRDMVRTFPNLRCCLMVGIGGGAPIPDLPDHDIRLGDVVVGAPVNDSRSGGVLQWDHGKTVQDKQFRSTQHLNGPPRFLMSAIHKLIQNHQLRGSPLRIMVNDVLAKSPHLVELGYQRPEGDRDQLYKSEFVHVARQRRGCLGNCDSDPSNLVTRRSRDRKVHYGVIGSGSSVMKDAVKRDQLAESEGILCFEMEVAGLVNHFPCLVIRGICDYSDTHKNDEWHGYAAMMAAAYTKELLRVLQPRKVSEEEKLSVSLEAVEKGLSSVDENVKGLKRKYDEFRKDEDHKLILEWLSSIDFTDRQNTAQRDRHKGTGEWFIKTTEFQTWLRDQGQTLFCPGMPGVGKTHMASLVVHHVQSLKTTISSLGIAYMYCDYREQHPQEALVGCLLKQLVGYTQSFPAEVEDLHQRHEVNRTRPSVDEYRETLCDVINSFERCFIVVDGLDESQEKDGFRDDLLLTLKSIQKKTKANLLATSRGGIPRILAHFEDIPKVQIQASNDDIDLYLDDQIPRVLPILGHRPVCSEPEHSVTETEDTGPTSTIRYDESEVDKSKEDTMQEQCSEAKATEEDAHQSGYNFSLHQDIKDAIRKVADGTFLIAMLHVTSLKGKVNVKQVKDAIKDIPSGGNARHDAYDKAMEMVQSQQEGYRKLAMDTLSWVAFSKQALTMEEVQHALAVEIGSEELDLDNVTAINVILSTCAGLITVRQGERTAYGPETLVYLVHETTQQYLNETQQRWFGDVSTHHAKICLTYLNYRPFGLGPCTTQEALLERLKHFAFYPYLTSNLRHYVEGSDETCADLLKKLFHSDGHVQSCIQASVLNRKRVFLTDAVVRMSNALHLSMYNRPTSIISAILQKGVNQQNHVSDTPLHIAVKERYHEGIRILLTAVDIDRNIPDSVNRTPLSYACAKGDEEAVELLLAASNGSLESSARLVPSDPYSFSLGPNQCDMFGYNPMTYTLVNGHNGVLKLLLASTEIDCSIGDLYGRLGLHWAAKDNNTVGLAELLRQPGMRKCINRSDRDRATPLQLALKEKAREAVDMLLETAQAEGLTLDDSELVRFYLDGAGNSKKYVDLLIKDADSDINAIVDTAGSPLALWVVIQKDDALFETLLARTDVNINGADRYGNTPLLWCTNKRYSTALKLLLPRADLDVNLVDSQGRNAFHNAAIWGNEEIMEQLLARPEAEFDALDEEKRTPLHFAAMHGNLAVVKLLLAKQTKPSSSGWTFHESPLYFAILKNQRETAAYLLEHLQLSPGNWIHDALYMCFSSSDFTCFDLLRPLFKSWMAQNPKWKLKYLLMAAKDASPATLHDFLSMLRGLQNDPASCVPFACPKWDDVPLLDIVSKLTLKDIDTLDDRQQTALHAAAARKDMRAVRLLIVTGANIRKEDGEGRTAANCITVAYSNCTDVDKRLFNLRIRKLIENGTQGRTVIERVCDAPPPSPDESVDASIDDIMAYDMERPPLTTMDVKMSEESTPSEETQKAEKED